MSTDIIDGAIRVSNLGGRLVSADSTMTIDQQKGALSAAIATVAQLHGKPYRLGRVVELLDESGFTSAGGDVLGGLLARVESGDSLGMVFAYQSRNGRNWWEQGPFFSRLEKARGLYVIKGLEGIDYRSPIGRQVFGMQAVQDEGVYWTAKTGGENTKEGMMSRLVYNRVPYGYQRNATWIDGRVVDKRDGGRDAKALVKADTAVVVERIFTLRDQDYGVGAIVGLLNDEGVPGPRGGRWTHPTVRSILANPIYKGLIVYGRRNRKRDARGGEPVVREVRDAAMQIVTPALWKRVQGKRGKVQRTGNYKADVAGGVLICQSCGRTLQIVGSGDGRRHYGCPRTDSTAPPCPRPVHVKQAAGDAYVDRLVSEHVDGLEVGKPVADARRVNQARKAVEAAQVELDALDSVPPSHPKFMEWATKWGDALLAAKAELERAEAEADMHSDMPESAGDYLARPMLGRNRIARALLRVEVAPPASRSRFADITARFTPVWR